MKPIIFDFIRKRVWQDGDEGYESELERVLLMASKQKMSARPSSPPPDRRPQ
jgi:hypothetical protein